MGLGKWSAAYAAMDAGGPRAGVWRNPRWIRIFSMTSSCSMDAIIRLAPQDWGHSRGSASKTCLISRAHCCLSPRVDAGARASISASGAALDPWRYNPHQPHSSSTSCPAASERMIASATRTAARPSLPVATGVRPVVTHSNEVIHHIPVHARGAGLLLKCAGRREAEARGHGVAPC